MNFVPCLTWVGKGIAKSIPDKLQLTTEELKSLIEETKGLSRNVKGCESNSEDMSGSEEIDEESVEEYDLDKDSEKEDCVGETKSFNDSENDNSDDFESKYNLNSYDDDEDDNKPFMNIKDVATFLDNKEDNYITDFDAVEEDDKEEEDNFVIKENDNLLLVGHIEEESSVLEVQVFNEEEDSLYVHHDIVLPAYPLALEWLDFHPSDETAGNYVAVADMTSIIKVWDLDVVDILEPDYCLGKEIKESKLEKLKLKYHTDAVLSLSWNKHVRNIMASGSADSSIVIWDLQKGKPLNKLEYHTNKVQSLSWHPFESSFLLSGCTDGFVKLYDCRAPEAECKSWKVEGEIEKVIWNLNNPIKFFCSSDQGFIYSIDLKSNDIEHEIKAHSDAVTGLDICPTRPNILVSASMDKTIKIWDIEKLKHIQTQKLKVGNIYVAKFCPDSKMTIAIGGNNRSTSLKLIDLAKKLEAFEQNDLKPIKKIKKKTEENDSKPNKKIKKTEENDSRPIKKIKKETEENDSKPIIKIENAIKREKTKKHFKGSSAVGQSPKKLNKTNFVNIDKNFKRPVHIKYEDDEEHSCSPPITIKKERV